KSMKGFQKRYLRAAPGLAEEQELLRLLGLTEISDLDDMTPRAIYISRGKATTKRLMDPEKHIARGPSRSFVLARRLKATTWSMLLSASNSLRKSEAFLSFSSSR
ncbi:hypothetical protein N8586_05380, partial [Verrucomicrobiales bacterium]|nr:hypothetical protein [Verrucomicrobiales bacterium]